MFVHAQHFDAHRAFTIASQLSLCVTIGNGQRIAKENDEDDGSTVAVYNTIQRSPFSCISAPIMQFMAEVENIPFTKTNSD